MSAAIQVGVPDDFRAGPLAAYLAGDAPIEVGDEIYVADDASARAVFCAYRLRARRACSTSPNIPRY